MIADQTIELRSHALVDSGYNGLEVVPGQEVLAVDMAGTNFSMVTVSCGRSARKGFIRTAYLSQAAAV